MKKYHFVIADVFTDEAFGGNQLGVFVDARGLSDNQMQKLANEMNYAETTFLFPSSRPDCDFKVRIFTPAEELPFAGHPLVGTGYVLGARNMVGLQGKVKRVNLDVKVGVVPVDLDIKNDQITRTTMTQPKPELIGRYDDKAALASALGISAEKIGPNGLPVEVISTGLPSMMVPVDSLETVQSIKANPDLLTSVSQKAGAKTVLVFTNQTVQPRANVHCRVFAPAAGVSEDAATGSANGPFGCYLVKHGIVSTPPKTSIVSEQGFEMNRPSTLYIDIEGVGEAITSVKVGGDVVITAEGEMFVGD
ncbi:MAG TPA: PhzF family phenazine biosynthesis protein [Blastocatellia bacterium]|nr:PhzF family phenazine biosynthesis protein [Blastocatellia bacterium]